jgi:ABC-type lipoprotein export system ATPase subunit
MGDMPATKPLLKLDQVSKRFDAPEGAGGISVLDQVSLSIARGESLAIVGPSGSGKSTLLHIMGTLDQPTQGEVWLDGQNLNQLPERELAQVRNRQVGFVFQFHYLLPQCTVLENVLVPTLAFETGRAPASAGETASARAVRLLTRMGLSERLSHFPGQLSGGERQRVAVVRALINQPQLLLADEPTGALDHASAQRLAQLLLELNQEEKVALVVVTHARDLAHKLGRVLELREGKLVPEDSRA